MLYGGKYSLRMKLLSEAKDFDTWKADAIASGDYKVAKLKNGKFARVNKSGNKFYPEHRKSGKGEYATEEEVWKLGHAGHVRANSGKDTQATFAANMKEKHAIDVKAGGVGTEVDLQFPNGAHGELGGSTKYTELGKWDGSKFVSADYPNKVAVLNNAKPTPIKGTLGPDAPVGQTVPAALVFQVWMNSGDDIILKYATKEGSDYKAFALTQKGVTAIPGKEIKMLTAGDCNDSTVGNRETGSTSDNARQGMPFSSLNWANATDV